MKANAMPISKRIRASKFSMCIVSEEMRKHLGYQMLLKFPNGYGVSLIRGPISYGGSQGKYEIAILLWAGKKRRICYKTPITSDVLGWLDEEEIIETLRDVRGLK